MTEDIANKKLKEFGDLLLKSDNINYVAVVEDDDYTTDGQTDYALEIGLLKKDSSTGQEQTHRPSKTEVDHILNHSPIKFLFNEIISDDYRDYKSDVHNYEDLKFREKVSPVKGLNLVASNPFDFQTNNYTIPGEQITVRDLPADHGTIGAIVKLSTHPKDYFILSNWHVLMKSIGSLNHILIDKEKNEIAELHWAVYNDFYDIALARIINAYDISNLCEVKSIKSIKDLELGDYVKKQGNTTGTKKNTIYSKNAYIKVGLENEKFKNQILVNKISEKGDSGSIVLDQNNEVIGLVMGGDGKKITICNNMIQLLNSSEIPNSIYTEYTANIKMPSIKFDSIFVNNSLIKF